MSPFRSTRLGGALKAIGFLLAIGPLVGAPILLGVAFFSRMGPDVGMMIVVAVVAIATMFVGFGFTGLGERIGGRGARRVIAEDSRPPVLYLRAFSSDKKGGEKEAPEADVARLFSPLGPTVAVGRPGEFLQTVGAARMYLSDAEWKAEVEGLIEKAGLVLIKVATSPGLLWEFATAIARLPAQKIVLIPPQDRGEWSQFRAAVNWPNLPEETQGAALICFDSQNRARLLWGLKLESPWWQDRNLIQRVLFLVSL